MARKLARTVTVQDPDSRRYVTVLAGTVPPPAYADLITNPAAWGDETPAEVAEAAEDGPPARSASKGAWKAYAVSQGMDEAEADDRTRNELAAQYLGED